jgi:RNA polymerase subunit RPABC4/transcription elongation factor Spt4
MLEALRFVIPPYKKPSPEDRAAVARSLIKACPVCGGSLALHQRWRLASVILDGDSSADEVAKLIDAHQWERASRFQLWKGDRDAREYLVVRCPNSPHAAIVTVFSTAELWSDDRVESTQKLNEEDSKAVIGLAGDHWESF